MDSFRYVNIFETKGLEYLLLIIFLVLFVFFVRYLRNPGEENGVSVPRGHPGGWRGGGAGRSG
jgi:hypothetical protein